MPTKQTELALRLDTLSRRMESPEGGWEIARGAVVAAALVAFLAVQVFVFNLLG